MGGRCMSCHFPIVATIGNLTVVLCIAAVAAATAAVSVDFSDLHIHGPAEYCEFDTFQPECEEGEVVVIRSARYGRMRLGRCVTAHLGHVSCSADVLDLVDAMCSGRRSCNVPVPHQALAARSSCMNELKLYLEVSYSCLKVATVSPAGCHQTCNHVTLTSTSGYLASDITRQSGCGGVDCPWHIRVPPSQAVELTLFNFARKSASVTSLSAVAATGDTASIRHHHVITGGRGGGGQAQAGGDTACRLVATVRDLDLTTTSSDRKQQQQQQQQTQTRDICAGALRTSLVFRSESNVVELRLVSRPNEHYVIHYQPVGCDQQVLPPGVSASHVTTAASDVTLLTCNYTGATWRVTCRNGHWLMPSDVNIRCEPIRLSGEEERSLASLDPSQPNIVPYGLLVASVISISVIVSTVIVVTGIIVYRRKYAPSSGRRRGSKGTRSSSSCSRHGTNGSHYCSSSSKSTSHTDSIAAGAGAGVEGAMMAVDARDYTLPADSILPPPPPPLADYYADELTQNVVLPPSAVNQQREAAPQESAYAHIWQHATMTSRRPPFSPNTRPRAYPGFSLRAGDVGTLAYDGLCFNNNSSESSYNSASQRYFYLEPDSGRARV